MSKIPDTFYQRNPDYKPDVDYRSKHLKWLQIHKIFAPSWWSPQPNNNLTYYEVMKNSYGPDGIKYNETAFNFFRADYKELISGGDINQQAATLFGVKPKKDEDPCYFVTINWSDNNFDPVKAVRDLKRLFGKSWVSSAAAVFERHTLKGNHPHVHIMLQVTKYKTFGHFKHKMFEQSIVQGIAPNFIDIKCGKQHHWEYVEGDKTPEKAECLEKDKVWRLNNDLDDLYSKNYDETAATSVSP